MKLALPARSVTALVARIARASMAMLLICAICALLVTYVLRLQSTLWQSMVFSLCIGSFTMLMIKGGYRLLWGSATPSKFGFGALIAISIPIAFILGGSVAGWLLNLPQRGVSLMHLHANAPMIILTVLGGIFSTWFFWTQARLERANADAAAIEQQATKAHLQMLQAQIEPHMLFNTLANLQGLIAFDPPRAQRLLDQLIVYLRATLSSSRADTTTLEQEFTLMEAYLEVMSVRMGPRLTFELRLPQALRATAIPPMLLQPLVENAIKHGLEPKREGGSVIVSATAAGGKLTLAVTDTGLGLQSGGDTGDDGIGVENVRRRLQAIYGHAATFSLQSNPSGGALALLTLPTTS